MIDGGKKTNAARLCPVVLRGGSTRCTQERNRKYYTENGREKESRKSGKMK
jgi:hypothetical protein